MFEAIAAETERVAAQVMDAAFKVHRALGPGLLESVYELYHLTLVVHLHYVPKHSTYCFQLSISQSKKHR